MYKRQVGSLGEFGCESLSPRVANETRLRHSKDESVLEVSWYSSEYRVHIIWEYRGEHMCLIERDQVSSIGIASLGNGIEVEIATQLTNSNGLLVLAHREMLKITDAVYRSVP